MRKLIATISVVTLVLAWLAMALVAYATTGFWYAGSKEWTYSGRDYAWPGVHAYNYVMDSPVIYNRHVNSVYLRRDDLFRGYEVGWFWPTNVSPYNGQPQWFAVVRYGGFKTEIFGPIAQKGYDPGNLLTVEITGSTAYMKVDSTVIYSEPQRMAYGYPSVGAERRDDRDPNYAHFWHMMKKDWDGTWRLWGNQELWKDNDPDYWVNRNGHTEVWVQHN